MPLFPAMICQSACLAVWEVCIADLLSERFRIRVRPPRGDAASGALALAVKHFGEKAGQSAMTDVMENLFQRGKLGANAWWATLPSAQTTH